MKGWARQIYQKKLNFFFFLEREGGMLSMLKEGDEIGSQPKMK